MGHKQTQVTELKHSRFVFSNIVLTFTVAFLYFDSDSL